MALKAQHILSVRNRVKNPVVSVNIHPFSLVRGAKTAAPAGELEQKLMATVGAKYTGKSLLQSTAFEIGTNHFSFHRSEKSVLTLKYFRADDKFLSNYHLEAGWGLDR